MSEIGVLTDVIDEIHEAERLLNPGDIPDRALFKHVRILWQLLLGIDETRFDSHNYEVFELKFTNDGRRFMGLTYLGSDRNLVNENLGNAVGFASKSLEIVQLLDEEDSDDGQETSVSFKLSLLNKIRYILFEHHMMVREFFNDDEVKSHIASFIRDDIPYSTNELRVSMNSNNHVLNTCYQECLESLLLQKDYTIDEVAKGVFQLFKHKAGVAYFFDFNMVSKFHNQMIALLKRSFRGHDFVNEEIEDFFRHNPILPVLKPLYRNFALQVINNDMKDKPSQIEKNDDKLIVKLNIELLKQILHEVTQKNNSELEDCPITMKWFPQIIQYYSESLMSEGVTNVENDLYITMIKKAAIRWIDNEIDTGLFVAQLSDLSLIPTAMPYLFQGVLFPTVHMRMALYTVKENIRLYEKYFDLWHACTIQKTSLEMKFDQWLNIVAKTYIGKWRTKLTLKQQIKKIDTYPLRMTRLRGFYETWKLKTICLKNNEKVAELKRCKKYFLLWRTSTKSYQKQLNMAQKYNDKILTKRFLTLWMAAKVCRFPEVLNKFAVIRRSLYFKLWILVQSELKHNVSKAAQFEKSHIFTRYFQLWKTRSASSINRLQDLKRAEYEFTLKKSFQKWKLQIHFLVFERDFQVHSNEMLLQRYFSQWRNFKKLVDNENLALIRSNSNKLLSFFITWKRAFIMNQQATKYYEEKVTQSMMKKWKLEYYEKIVEKKCSSVFMKGLWRKWILKTTISQYEMRKYDLLLRNNFSRWFEKSITLKKRLENCEKTYPILKTASYFDFWRKVCLKNRKDEKFADDFRRRKLEESKNLVMKWAFRAIVAKYDKIQKSILDLHSFESFYRNRELKKYFSMLKMRKKSHDFHVADADDFYKVITLTNYYNIWLSEFDRVSNLQDVLISKQDTDNVHLLMQILSKLQLKMMKVQTDLTNAKKFSDRWNKIKTKTFFELWKLKQSARNSPTPTARAGGNQGATNNGNSDFKLIPELNPYIDLAPRDRGSPVNRPPYLSRMQSVLTGDVSQYEIEQQVDGRDESKAEPTLLFGSLSQTPARFRTPSVRKTSSRILTNSALKSSPDTSSIFTSAERVRKRNLEERVSRYRLLRSPPKTGHYQLESVEKSLHEERISQDSSIFDTSSESIGSSTPIKKLDIIEL